MKWTIDNDNSKPIISAESHIKSGHSSFSDCILPETCVIFEMGMAMNYMEEVFETETLVEKLPCFLDNPKCISIKDRKDVCFTRGGYGSPAAVDTLETVRALGVKRIIVIGMCGVYENDVNVGDVIIPHKILSEEGTSRHYFDNIEFVSPNRALFAKAKSYFTSEFVVNDNPTVTSDAFYRQTFAKESLWREKGCIGVDMESSALLAVSQFYSMPSVAILLASDKHPISQEDANWEWGNNKFREIRKQFVEQAVLFALNL